MEENRTISWSDLFIKIILIILFVLFTVWLLSLSNKNVSNSLEVLTDNIFVENMDRMKDVGKDYFTTERLPQKVGDVKTLTLEEMYEKKLILEVKDKDGKACNAEKSYVSIEKFDNEYQMKVNLNCGDKEEYIIVIMGCYDYCDTDICEKEETVTPSEEIEYEYKKTTGGKWTDYGKWSEWSKTPISKNDYRQVETKKENEKYTYNKTVTETLYESFDAVCPDGYKLTADGTKCYKEVKTIETKNPTCPILDGYKFEGRDGFTCSYSKTEEETTELICPTLNGWNYIGRDGNTCNYSRTVNYQYTEEKTCYKQEIVKSCATCAPVIQNVPYDCSETKTGTKTEYNTSVAVCPTGFTKSGTRCIKKTTSNETGNAVCLAGYTKNGNTCIKEVVNNSYEDYNKVCPSGYKLTTDGSKCYKTVEKTVQETGTKEVTYYRYRVREYVGGTTDYKWSKSKNDKSLLDAGYKLTGRTR